MNFNIKDIISVIFIGCLAGFILGWIFPVEGPIDHVYDDYVGNTTIKKPVIGAPKPKAYEGLPVDVSDLREVLIDLNGDEEQEWYLFMPLLRGEHRD